MRILIIADEPHLQRVASWVLEQEGMDVDVVDTPENALEITRLSSPDVIVMDTSLPPAEKAAAIASYKRTIPSLGVLDLGPQWPEELGVAADAYLQRPFDGDQLVSKVKEAIDVAMARKGPPASQPS